MKHRYIGKTQISFCLYTFRISALFIKPKTMSKLLGLKRPHTYNSLPCLNCFRVKGLVFFNTLTCSVRSVRNTTGIRCSEYFNSLYRGDLGLLGFLENFHAP